MLLTQIRVGQRARSLSEEAILWLMESIKTIGLQTPVSVQEESAESYLLIAGLHRLEACRRLGMEQIDVKIVNLDETHRRMWEITENLHRADLTVLERSEHIAEWLRLAGERDALQVATHEPRKPGQSPGGVNKAARELNIEKTEAHRATKIDGLAPEAKDEAKALKLDDNKSALLEASKTKSKEEQLRTLREKAAEKTQKAAAAPASKERKADKPKALRNPRDEWVATSSAIFSGNVSEALHALVAIMRNHANQIRERVPESQRKALLEQVAEALGLKIVS